MTNVSLNLLGLHGLKLLLHSFFELVALRNEDEPKTSERPTDKPSCCCLKPFIIASSSLSVKLLYPVKSLRPSLLILRQTVHRETFNSVAIAFQLNPMTCKYISLSSSILNFGLPPVLIFSSSDNITRFGCCYHISKDFFLLSKQMIHSYVFQYFKVGS